MINLCPNILFETFMPNLVSINCPSLPRYWAKLRRGCFHFQISGQSLIKENCYNSRTTDDIDIKLRPVTKIDKRNKTTSKKFNDDVMSENCDVIVIFRNFWPIWSSLEAGFRIQSLQKLCFQ